MYIIANDAYLSPGTEGSNPSLSAKETLSNFDGVFLLAQFFLCALGGGGIPFASQKLCLRQEPSPSAPRVAALLFRRAPWQEPCPWLLVCFANFPLRGSNPRPPGNDPWDRELLARIESYAYGLATLALGSACSNSNIH